jgi:hypothetical protein
MSPNQGDRGSAPVPCCSIGKHQLAAEDQPRVGLPAPAGLPWFVVDLSSRRRLMADGDPVPHHPLPRNKGGMVALASLFRPTHNSTDVSHLQLGRQRVSDFSIDSLHGLANAPRPLDWK